MIPSCSIVMGTLVGGAVGDAMGAPYEGLWSEDIPDKETLVSSFHEYDGFPTGQYTDDTQLTIATIQSIVQQGDVVIPDIARAISELWRHHAVIGPGGACTQAAEKYLSTGDHRDMGAPVGQAGNGTAMRTAAIGLWFGTDQQSLVSTVAEISRLTHQDPRSVAGGVAVAFAANALANDHTIGASDLCDLIADGISTINPEFSTLIRVLPEKMKSPSCIEFIADAGQSDSEFTTPIITPFVIPTVLASLYCINLHRNSWVDAVTSAVKLGGDVDTLGSIVGALAGAVHGMDGIPPNLASGLHESTSIRALATRYHAAMTHRLTERDGEK